MDITDVEFEAANRRGAAKKAAFPAAVAVRYDRRIARVVISLASGLEIAFSPRDAQGLENARPADLAGAEISPSGLGVRFPKLDADLYIPALLEGFLGSKRWMASQMGKAARLRPKVRRLRRVKMGNLVADQRRPERWWLLDRGRGHQIPGQRGAWLGVMGRKFLGIQAVTSGKVRFLPFFQDGLRCDTWPHAVEMPTRTQAKCWGSLVNDKDKRKGCEKS